MQRLRYGHGKWRGHSYALNLRGGHRNLEPLSTYKNAPRHKGVCIALYMLTRNRPLSAFSLCFLNRTIPH